jgi:hypothetical protein
MKVEINTGVFFDVRFWYEDIGFRDTVNVFRYGNGEYEKKINRRHLHTKTFCTISYIDTNKTGKERFVYIAQGGTKCNADIDVFVKDVGRKNALSNALASDDFVNNVAKYVGVYSTNANNAKKSIWKAYFATFTRCRRNQVE